MPATQVRSPRAAWLDGATLAYTRRASDGTPSIWTVPADGSGAPRVLVPGAESPSPLSQAGAVQ